MVRTGWLAKQRRGVGWERTFANICQQDRLDDLEAAARVEARGGQARHTCSRLAKRRRGTRGGRRHGSGYSTDTACQLPLKPQRARSLSQKHGFYAWTRWMGDGMGPRVDIFPRIVARTEAMLVSSPLCRTCKAARW